MKGLHSVPIVPDGAFRLLFPEPVCGPICIGHSSHFGGCSWPRRSLLPAGRCMALPEPRARVANAVVEEQRCDATVGPFTAPPSGVRLVRFGHRDRASVKATVDRPVASTAHFDGLGCLSSLDHAISPRGVP